MSDKVEVAEPIEGHVLGCVWCRGAVPTKRNGQMAHTCSPECNAKYKKWRRWKRGLTRCQNCSRPATVEERKDFILWRRSRGERYESRGNPRKKEMLLKRSLGEAIEAMEQLLGGDDSPVYREKMARFQNLVDGKAGSGSTLAASGQPPEETD